MSIYLGNIYNCLKTWGEELTCKLGPEKMDSIPPIYSADSPLSSLIIDTHERDFKALPWNHRMEHLMKKGFSIGKYEGSRPFMAFHVDLFDSKMKKITELVLVIFKYYKTTGKGSDSEQNNYITPRFFKGKNGKIYPSPLCTRGGILNYPASLNSFTKMMRNSFEEAYLRNCKPILTGDTDRNAFSKVLYKYWESEDPQFSEEELKIKEKNLSELLALREQEHPIPEEAAHITKIDLPQAIADLLEGKTVKGLYGYSVKLKKIQSC